MQGRFIGELKENLKALKQELKGADIFNVPVKFSENTINSKEFVLQSSVHGKEFIIQSAVHEKKLGIEAEVYGIKEGDIIPEIKKFSLGIDATVKNYDFVDPETNVNNKDLEKFITVTKAKPIELTKKSKILKANIDKFKIKTYEGTDKIRQIPAIIKGRRFLTNKELIDLAIKIKTNNRSLDFTRYNFKAVFENLNTDFIDDYQYLDDSVELKIYYKKYSNTPSVRKQLVILTEKNSLNTEKIFV